VLSEIASVARAFHAEGRTLQGLRPETLGRSEGRLWLTPRWLAFLTGAEPGPPGPAPFAVIYTAPELFEQRRLGPAADVFTLAVLACEWLSGRHPFAAQGPLHRLAVLAAKPTFLPPGFPAGPFERDPMRRPRLDVWLGQLARSVS
jgi:hypothetical protein